MNIVWRCLGGGADGDETGVPHNDQQAGTSKKLQQTQATVDEIAGIRSRSKINTGNKINNNMKKVLDQKERDQILAELEKRADKLQHSFSTF